MVVLELWGAMSETIALADGFAVTAGCSKQFSTCKAKFDNGTNFHGFPHMSAARGAVQYPNRSQKLDGKSRYGN